MNVGNWPRSPRSTTGSSPSSRGVHVHKMVLPFDVGPSGLDMMKETIETLAARPFVATPIRLGSQEDGFSWSYLAACPRFDGFGSTRMLTLFLSTPARRQKPIPRHPLHHTRP